MPIEDDVTAQSLGQPSEDQSGTTNGSASAEIMRLRETLAKERDQMKKASQQYQRVGNIVNKMWNTPGGQEIIRKIEAGEELTLAQEKKVEKAEAQAAEGNGTSASGLTLEQIQQVVANQLAEFDKSSRMNRQAEKSMEKLNTWASKNLEGYEDVAGTDKWNKALGSTLAFIENGSLEVPEESTDVYKYAIEHTYDVLFPGARKETPAKADEKERKAKISAQTSRSAGAPEDNNADESPELRWAKAGPRSTIGRRW